MQSMSHLFLARGMDACTLRMLMKNTVQLVQQVHIHIPGAMKLCETQLIAEEDYKCQNTYFCTVDWFAYCVLQAEYGPVELTAPCSS